MPPSILSNTYHKVISNASGKLHKPVAPLHIDVIRLILYFPVSALVTLFGNILQNPQDPRARSDVRLMSLVVQFLSMLMAEAENGGVKRMLGVCSEFERIAKVVLDKAEREHSSRRKRKSNEDPALKNLDIPRTPMHRPAPSNNDPAPMPGLFSPGSVMSPNGFSPFQQGSSPSSQPWKQGEYTNGNGNEYMKATANGMTPFGDIQGFTNGNEINSPLNLNTFQQPFVPQDLWQMPMTLEWDWADMTGGQYPSFENGLVGDPLLQNNDGSNLQQQLANMRQC